MKKINNNVAGRIKLMSKMMETAIRSGKPMSLERFLKIKGRNDKSINAIIESSYAPDDQGKKIGKKRLFCELTTNKEKGLTDPDFHTVTNHEDLVKIIPNAPEDIQVGYWGHYLGPKSNTWFLIAKTQTPGLYCVAIKYKNPGFENVTYKYDNLKLPTSEPEDYLYIPPTDKEK